MLIVYSRMARVADLCRVYLSGFWAKKRPELPAPILCTLPRAWIAPRSTLGSLRSARIAPCFAPNALRWEADIAASNTLRRVPCPDISGLRTLRSHRPRIAPRSTLDAPRFARIAPYSAPCVPCWSRISPRSALLNSAPRSDCSLHDPWLSRPYTDCSAPGPSRPRLLHGLLHASRIASCASHGYLRAPHLTPSVRYGSLRIYHFEFRTGHELLRTRHLAFHALLRLLLAPHLSPCAGRELLRVQHLVLYIGAFRISLQNRHF